jgi:hypothetical protein
MQTVADNQEQTVIAAKDTIENRLESQREIPHTDLKGAMESNYLYIMMNRIQNEYAIKRKTKFKTI